MFQRLEIGVKLKIKESTSQFLGTKTKRTISFSQGIIEFAQVKLHVNMLLHRVSSFWSYRRQFQRHSDALTGPIGSQKVKTYDRLLILPCTVKKMTGLPSAMRSAVAGKWEDTPD